MLHEIEPSFSHWGLFPKNYRFTKYPNPIGPLEVKRPRYEEAELYKPELQPDQMSKDGWETIEGYSRRFSKNYPQGRAIASETFIAFEWHQNPDETVKIRAFSIHGPIDVEFPRSRIPFQGLT